MVPASKRIQIFSDFDGTITDQDSLKLLLTEFAGPQWPQLEKKLLTGQISERNGLQKAFESLDLSFNEALRFVLKEVRLDPHFKPFFQWIQSEGFGLQVLSGGFENFIRPLLAREGLEGVSFLANRVRVRSKIWNVEACAVERLCSLCNHCKTASLVNALRRDPDVFMIYLGDGMTDTCPIQLADLILAKSSLQKYCREQHFSYVPFENFLDAQRILRALLPQPSVWGQQKAS